MKESLRFGEVLIFIVNFLLFFNFLGGIFLLVFDVKLYVFILVDEELMEVDFEFLEKVWVRLEFELLLL